MNDKPMTTDPMPAHNEPVSLKDLRLTPRDLLLMAWLNQRGVTAEAEEEFEKVLSSLLSTARADGKREGLEEAAKAANPGDLVADSYEGAAWIAARADAAAAIRALSVSTEGKNESGGEAVDPETVQ